MHVKIFTEINNKCISTGAFQNFIPVMNSLLEKLYASW